MGFTRTEERERREKLPSCTTVEEVEALRCNECANDHHYGWCDAPWIECDFKDKIKSILRETEDEHNSFVDSGRTIIQKLHDIELLIYNYIPKKLQNGAINIIQEAQMELLKSQNGNTEDEYGF